MLHRTSVLCAILSSLLSGFATPALAAGQTVTVIVGKSAIVDTDSDIVRVAVGSATLAETVAINSREIMINGLLSGETTLVIWEEGGKRTDYELTVRPSALKLDAIRQQLAVETAGQEVTLSFENDTAFLRGTVKDAVTADRATKIAATLGKVVNLLYVNAPPVQSQVLLRVRFLDVDRSVSRQLGVNLLSSTGQLTGATNSGTFTLSDVINLMLIRKDFNLTATLTALQTNKQLQVLAEPNLLTIDGQPASFLAGGLVPYPTIQGGAQSGSVTVAFQEFGVRLKFIPHITPQGTIRMRVNPEVSSLDFANGLTYQGFNIPGIDTRKVDTEVELESGQSFAIAGLLDNQVTQTLSRVPGISNIPVLGKLFETRSKTTENTELLVVITPEIVRPVPAGVSVPDLAPPNVLDPSASRPLPRTPGTQVTGPVPVAGEGKPVPLETLQKSDEAQRALAELPGGAPSVGGPAK